MSEFVDVKGTPTAQASVCSVLKADVYSELLLCNTLPVLHLYPYLSTLGITNPTLCGICWIVH